jgi:hypothetical protein
MTFGDWVILGIAACVLVGIATHRTLPPHVRNLLMAGLVLRLVGGQLYLLIGEVVYGGTADYWYYFHHGAWYAKALWAGTPEASGSYWLELGVWWGTPFTIRTSGVLIAALNPSIYGAFLAFSLIGYVGILAFAVAFRRAFPAAPAYRYLQWLVLFPSLWYWPAALGKDALMLAGIGVAVLGFVGWRGRPNWLALAAGTALVFVVRPPIAVVLLLAFGAGYWLALMRYTTAPRLVQGIVIATVGFGVLLAAAYTMGLSITNTSELSDYLVGTKSGAAGAGGSSIAVDEEDILNPVEGAVSVLARPFLWEARSATALFAACEIMAVWILAWIERHRISNFIRLYRGHPVFWMATIFIVVYAITLGMAAGNLGIIARQRVHLFPLLFMFFAGPVMAGPMRHVRSRSSDVTRPPTFSERWYSR